MSHQTVVEELTSKRGSGEVLPLGVEGCQGNADFVCKEFSLGPNLKRLGAACISAAQFEQNRKGTEFWFVLVCQKLVSWTLPSTTTHELCLCICNPCPELH